MTEPTNTRDSSPDSTRVETDILDHPHRRYLCYCLYLYATPMKLLDIATQLAVWETERGRDPKPGARHDIYQSLQRKHLPALRDAGFVSYNRPEDMMTVGPAEDDFERLVKRHLPRDFEDLLRAEAESFDSDRESEAFPNETVEN